MNETTATTTPDAPAVAAAAETVAATYSVPGCNLAGLRGRVAELNKRARRLRVPEIDLTAEHEFDAVQYRVDHDRGRTFWHDGRKPLPEAWAGKRGQELEDVSGIEGANFCHGYRFCGGGKNLEAAIAMAKAAIEIDE